MFADQIVNPAPAGPPAVIWADQAAPSFDVLHAVEVAWLTQLVLVRWGQHGLDLRPHRGAGLFNARSLVQNAADFSGTRTLDCFLIPPVSTKNEYSAPTLRTLCGGLLTRP